MGKNVAKCLHSLNYAVCFEVHAVCTANICHLASRGWNLVYANNDLMAATQNPKPLRLLALVLSHLDFGRSMFQRPHLWPEHRDLLHALGGRRRNKELEPWPEL